MAIAEGQFAALRQELPEGFIREDWDAKTFEVSRSVLRTWEIFDMERRLMWDRLWLYLGHESELPEPGDFKARTVGGRPLIFCRDSDGEIRAWLNACPHKGTILCRETHGNTGFFRCFYHAWAFDNRGALTAIPDEEAYPQDSDFRERHGLRSVPRFAIRRGFVFVSFDPDVQDLDDYLGSAGDYIDMVSEHSVLGMEVLGGTHLYGVRGNWKLAVENAMDGYHFSPTHTTFISYLKDTGYVTSDEEGEARPLANGHSILLIPGHSGRVGLEWEPRFGEDARLRIEENRRRLVERLGEERATRIYGLSRILYVFPNLLLFDIEAISIRQLEPVAPDYTNVAAWELAPIGESDEERALRIKVLTSFVGPGGLASPDDIEAYECQQRGVVATAGDPRPGVDWTDISRGMEREARGEPGRTLDEVALRSFWRHWNAVMTGTASA